MMNLRIISVVPGGFEPPLTEPKTVVLPLHHRTSNEKLCKGNAFLCAYQIFVNVSINVVFSLSVACKLHE